MWVMIIVAAWITFQGMEGHFCWNHRLFTESLDTCLPKCRILDELWQPEDKSCTLGSYQCHPFQTCIKWRAIIKTSYSPSSHSPQALRNHPTSSSHKFPWALVLETWQIWDFGILLFYMWFLYVLHELPFVKFTLSVIGVLCSREK